MSIFDFILKSGAINLDNGQFEYLDFYEPVELINAKLVVS